jgi:hypothetical protein
MEILIGLISTGVVELIKMLSAKFGKELSEKIVHTTVFAVVAVGTYAITENLISMETINHYIQIFATSYTTYKLILNPGLKVAGLK